MEISSRDNPTFKNLLKLCQKKHRREQGLCIIEGEKIVSENKKAVQQILVRKDYVKRFPDAIILDDKLFDLVTSLETDPGVLAIMPLPKPGDISFPYLVLDRVSDPGNLGALFRSAAAFGFGTVICLDCADAFSQKTLRAAVGMQFHLNIIETNFAGFSETFNRELRDSALLVADMGGSMQFKGLSQHFGLVLGNEGQGISPEVKNLPHKVVSIPMNPACESLNVAVAGGILMNYLSQTKGE